MPTTTPIVEDTPAPATAETGDYSKTPLKSVHELKKLFRAATRGLPTVQAPALVFKSSVDGVVPPSSVATISRHIASSRLKVVTLPHSGHVATLDVDAPTIFEESASVFPSARRRQSSLRVIMNMLPDFSPFLSSWNGTGPRVGVVMSHGFTGSPHSVRPWAEHLAAAGYAVRLPLLPGHGTTWQDMATRSWRSGTVPWMTPTSSWPPSAITFSPRACPWVARWPCGSRPRVPWQEPWWSTRGLVLDDPRAVIVAALKYVVKTTPAIANDILKPDQDEGAYARTPVAAAHQLKKMYKDTAAILPRISSPSGSTNPLWTT